MVGDTVLIKDKGCAWDMQTATITQPISAEGMYEVSQGGAYMLQPAKNLVILQEIPNLYLRGMREGRRQMLIRMKDALETIGKGMGVGV